ncbi:alpha/beta hydrolase [Arenibaculum pallidiluteum]|uniref:alpha/beta hydrolase n=1 Tax=Arenibaculum pallidiluteum TaxID=2812559 RepID=UPI001A979425|nr:hypothetical protein [Arenibaculum pallidiluteum]
MHDEAWLELVPRGGADLAVVMMHGRGRSPEEMRDLAERLDLPRVRYVFPAASGASWYPKGFLTPVEENEPHLSAALNHYERVVGALMAEGFVPDRIVLGGFSQGACLTAEFLARSPRRYAGALVFTGGLIGPPGTDWPVRPELDGMPVLLTTSEVDEWVPPSRVHETSRWLQRCGALVELRIFETRPHVVDDEELAAARNLIERTRHEGGRAR